MGVNSLPNTVTRQRRGCDLNLGPSAPESSTLTTRLPSNHLCSRIDQYNTTNKRVNNAIVGGRLRLHDALWWVSSSTCLSVKFRIAAPAKPGDYAPLSRRLCTAVTCEDDVIHRTGSRKHIALSLREKGAKATVRMQLKTGKCWNVVLETRCQKDTHIQTCWSQYFAPVLAAKSASVTANCSLCTILNLSTPAHYVKPAVSSVVQKESEFARVDKTHCCIFYLINSELHKIHRVPDKWQSYRMQR